MLTEKKFEERIWRGRWMLIAIVVVVVLAVIQMIRVNRPQQNEVAEPPIVKYTDRGPLLTGKISIEPSAFHSVRIALNRRAKLTGTFRTPSLKERVGVLLLDEANFESWKAQNEFRSIVATGAIPVGRINPVFGPGIFFLVLDNRANGHKQTVETEFLLD